MIRDVPEAFAPKHRWAMDWYYPVLGGVVLGDAGRARLDERSDTFLMDGRGVRCVSDRPWITVAETCECALAHLAVGDRQMAETLFGWAQQFRHDEDGRYWTGTVFPDEARFPGGERSPTPRRPSCSPPTPSAGGTPASALFVDHDAVLPPRCSSTTTLSRALRTLPRPGLQRAEDPQAADGVDLLEAPESRARQ